MLNVQRDHFNQFLNSGSVLGGHMLATCGSVSVKEDGSYINESTSAQSMSKRTVDNHSPINAPSWLSKIKEYHVADVQKTKEEVRRLVSKKCLKKEF